MTGVCEVQDHETTINMVVIFLVLNSYFAADISFSHLNHSHLFKLFYSYFTIAV